MKNKRPQGLLRWFFRLPIWLYRRRLGWLMGQRFLMLSHVGRKSGLPRFTVLEVVKHDLSTNIYYVVSGWGPKADWYQNICQTPKVTISVGARQYQTKAQSLSLDEAIIVLKDYAQRHPKTFQVLLSKFLGHDVDTSEESYKNLAVAMPVVAFQYKP